MVVVAVTRRGFGFYDDSSLEQEKHFLLLRHQRLREMLDSSQGLQYANDIKFIHELAIPFLILIMPLKTLFPLLLWSFEPSEFESPEAETPS